MDHDHGYMMEEGMHDRPWWQGAVFYQIYPRSFYDLNGDGIGDLPGITSKLDYLQDLGVDAIWLSPHYPSPQFDCGYDVADYTAVEPAYGSLEDFQAFLAGAHQRGLRVILDLVLNHTSEDHPWFQESRSSRANPFRDWYLWAPGQDDRPPNNWQSTFGGPAWELDYRTGEYYYHFFFKQQPDLNWDNPKVKEAMKDVMRFWLDLGVDGFRLDAIGTIFEHPDRLDHDSAISQAELFHRWEQVGPGETNLDLLDARRRMFRHQVEQPRVHALMQELRQVVDEYDDRILVGETDEIAYYGTGSDELHLVFNFPLMRTKRLSPRWVLENQRARLSALPAGAWPSNTLGNHDTSRVYSRFGDGHHGDSLARLSLALMLTLRGTPFLYNGEEIGMSDLLLTDPAQFKDNVAVWYYQMEHEVFSTPAEKAAQKAAVFGRDKCRTPMQWAHAPNAGFSPPGVTTWLPVHTNFRHGVNVADQRTDPDSMLNFYRRLLRLRRRSPALKYGDFEALTHNHPDVLVFLRRLETDSTLVALNWAPNELKLSSDLTDGLVVSFSSADRSTGKLISGALSLAPHEVFIAQARPTAGP